MLKSSQGARTITVPEIRRSILNVLLILLGPINEELDSRIESEQEFRKDP